MVIQKLIVRCGLRRFRRTRMDYQLKLQGWKPEQGDQVIIRGSVGHYAKVWQDPNLC